MNEIKLRRIFEKKTSYPRGFNPLITMSRQGYNMKRDIDGLWFIIYYYYRPIYHGGGGHTFTKIHTYNYE